MNWDTRTMEHDCSPILYLDSIKANKEIYPILSQIL